jgi:pectate lyase
MKNLPKNHSILKVILLSFITLTFLSANSFAAEAKSSDPNQSSKYLDAVREFADNVLKYGRDTYGPKHTPLFVDGVNVNTHEPVKWIDPNGSKWILSNLASQQSLFRTLDGLSKMTGDQKYRQTAMNAIEYAFGNLRSPNGLLYWGVYTAYDVQGDEVIPENSVHILKANLPYYELMWQVNPEETRRFIESFWSAHIKDWLHLDMDRIGQYNAVLEEPWNHEYEEGPVYLESGGGIPFLNAGTDLLYAAAMLTKLSGDKEPLVWAKRLAFRYVRTRHPNTGISYYMYKKLSNPMRDSYDSVMRKIEGEETNSHFIDMFPWTPYILGEKSAEEYERGQLSGEYRRGIFTPTPGMPVNQPISYWQTQFLVGEMLAGEGDEFKQWPLEELTAFGKASYRKEDNVYVPILTDGTIIDGYVVKEEGTFFGPKGGILQPAPVWPSDLWAYAMGYRVTKDAFMWEMACNIAKGNEFGDIGTKPEDKTQLNIVTDCANPYALLAFLELYRATEKTELLNIAKRIGDNILDSRFHKGFFVASSKHIYTKFDSIDSLSLLHLHSALAGDATEIPQAWPHSSHFNSPYRLRGYLIDNDIVYTRTDPSELPLTLQEAATSGDIALVRSLVDVGADLDFSNDGNKTALQLAAMNGHKEIVELLLVKGARIDDQKSYPGRTALDYAVEKGHKDVVELLINKGADVNVEIIGATGYSLKGNTPLHTAVRMANKDIVELLINKKADVNVKNDSGQTPLDIILKRPQYQISRNPNHAEIRDMLLANGAEILSIHQAVHLGDLEKVKEFLEQGIDINAKDENGQTSLYIAVRNDNKEIVKLLIDKGADANVKDAQGGSPLYIAVSAENNSMAELLIKSGADVNGNDAQGRGILYTAVVSNNKDMVELLLKSGADVNARGMRGRTILQTFQEEGRNKEIVDLLTKAAESSRAEEDAVIDPNADSSATSEDN